MNSIVEKVSEIRLQYVLNLMKPQTVELDLYDQVFFYFEPTIGNASSSITNLIEDSIDDLIGEL
jgi:hypothetical protein